MPKTTLEDFVKGAFEEQMNYFDFSEEEKEEVKVHLDKSMEALNKNIAKRIKTKWTKAKGQVKKGRLFP